MKRVFVLAAIALSLGCRTPASAQYAGDLVKRAVAAAGGEQALRGIKSLEISGEAKNWEPDESLMPGGAPPFLGDSKFTFKWDLAKDSVRTAWDRSLLAQGRMAYEEIITPAYGVVTDQKGAHAMSGIRVAAQLRELHRIAPNLLIRMLDNPRLVTFDGGVRTTEGVQPGVDFRDGGTTFTVIFNKKTQLPALVRTQDDDVVRGTTNYEVRFDDWKSEGGAMLPHQLTFMVGGVGIARWRYTSVSVNPPLDAALFAAPDNVRASLKPPANSNVPYQWVLRRIGQGVFLDSDQVFVPPGGSLKLVELAPNVQQVVGGTYNSLIVAMKDGIVVFDAPVNDEQSRWTMEAARAKYEKPIKYLVLTHHHYDHAGGVRAYMAEGATILVGQPEKKYFVKVSLSEHLVPDRLQSEHISPKIEEIKDQMVLKDDTMEVRLYRIPNHHAEGMLIGHVLPANIVWVTDLWSPGVDKTKSSNELAFNDALRRFNITGATIAGGHGTTAPQSELEAILAVK